MKDGKRNPLIPALLGVLWLGVVVASVFLVLKRREEYGAYVYVAPCMAVLMLIIFVISFLPRKGRESSLGEVLGRISVIALICLALAVLGYAIIKVQAGFLTKGVLILFFVVFVRILTDYVRHCTQSKKPRGESAEGAEEDS